VAVLAGSARGVAITALLGLAANALPGSASAAEVLPTQEIHGDWQVTCGERAGVNRCAMLQQQSSAQGKQRVLAVELARRGDSAEGMLMLPFGLLLDHGAQLQIDDGEQRAEARFRTCVPAGCLLPISLPAATLAALRAAKLLKVHVKTADGGNDAVFSISMRGFAESYDRLTSLAAIP
jgi:invasion protein IalB